MSRRRKLVSLRLGSTIRLGPVRVNLSRSGISLGLDLIRRKR